VFWPVDPSRRSTDARNSSGARSVLALLAALAVLACGGWDLARSSGRGASASSPAAAPSSGLAAGRATALTASDRQAPLRVLEVRAVPLAGVPAPPRPSDADGQGRVAADVPRGPSSALPDVPHDAQTGRAAGVRSGRGPPTTAGTDVTLPPRP